MGLSVASSWSSVQGMHLSHQFCKLSGGSLLTRGVNAEDQDDLQVARQVGQGVNE